MYIVRRNIGSGLIGEKKRAIVRFNLYFEFVKKRYKVSAHEFNVYKMITRSAKTRLHRISYNFYRKLSQPKGHGFGTQNTELVLKNGEGRWSLVSCLKKVLGFGISPIFMVFLPSGSKKFG